MSFGQGRVWFSYHNCPTKRELIALHDATGTYIIGFSICACENCSICNGLQQRTEASGLIIVLNMFVFGEIKAYLLHIDIFNM